MKELFVKNIIPLKTMSEIFRKDLGTGFQYGQTSTSGQTLFNPRIISGILEGCTFRSRDTGARIEMFPVADANVGMVVYDDANSEVFKIMTAGTDVGDVIFGSSSYYLKWDKSAGKLLQEGAVITGIQSGSEIAIQGWQHDMAFTATDHDTVAWAAGTITLLDGTTYNITGANTGDMAAITYIYLDIGTSITVLQTSTTASNAVGSGKILIATAENVAAGNNATFQVLGGNALGGLGKLIVASDIVANTITANEILANTITASEIGANIITANEISTGLYAQIDANLPSDENLVGYWAFDEGAGSKAYDGSGNDNTGTLQNMEEADWVDGVAGGALSFGGTDEYINIPDNATLDVTDTISISVWVKTSYSAANQTVICKNETANDRPNYNIDILTDGKVRFFGYEVASAKGNTTGTSDVNDGNWHHIVGTFDGTDWKIYIDGALSSTTTDSATLSTTGEFLGIGIRRTADSPFVGEMTEPRIYKQILTAKESYALYKNPSAQPSLAVPIGRLTTGTIYTKQITLAVVEGTGDSYIAAGKTDFGQDSTVGFILGVDDSDSNTPKLELTGGTITAPTFQTSSGTGNRIIITNTDTLAGYDASNNQTILIDAQTSTEILKLYPQSGTNIGALTIYNAGTGHDIRLPIRATHRIHDFVSQPAVNSMAGIRKHLWICKDDTASTGRWQPIDFSNFIYRTDFESLDNFYTSFLQSGTATYTKTDSTGYSTLATGATAGGEALIMKSISYSGLTWATDRKVRWTARFNFAHDTEAEATMGIGNVIRDVDNTSEHTGFKFLWLAGVTRCYCTSGNGTTRVATDIEGNFTIAADTNYVFEIEWLYNNASGDNLIKFYVDGVEVASHVNHVWMNAIGTSYKDTVLTARVYNATATVDRQLYLGNWAYWEKTGIK